MSKTVWRRESRLGAETIADRADGLAAQLALHVLEDLLDDGVDLFGRVARAFAAVLQPVHDVEALGAVQGDGVAVEEVGHDDEVAVGGELVGDELGVDEAVADDLVGKRVSGELVWNVSEEDEHQSGSGWPSLSAYLWGRRSRSRLHYDQCPRSCDLPNGVPLTVVHLLHLSGSLSFMLDADSAALSGRIGSHCDRLSTVP